MYSVAYINCGDEAQRIWKQIDETPIEIQGRLFDDQLMVTAGYPGLGTVGSLLPRRFYSLSLSRMINQTPKLPAKNRTLKSIWTSPAY